MTEPLYTRRQWLYMQVMMDGTPWYIAVEAVSSTAIAHPEWDLDETKTWKEWQESSTGE